MQNNKGLTYALMKSEHQMPYGYLKPLDILEWRWEKTTTTNFFMTNLPMPKIGHDKICIIVDLLIKISLFLAVKEIRPMKTFPSYTLKRW